MTGLQPYLDLARTIPGWAEHQQFDLPVESVTVEIGAFLGRGTVLLAGACKIQGSGKVYVVDPFDCSGDEFSARYYRKILDALGGGSLRQRFDDNIRRAGLTDWVEVRQGLALEVVATWHGSIGIDLLVLDGDQTPQGARAAYEAWTPFVKPQGSIISRTTPRWPSSMVEASGL